MAGIRQAHWGLFRPASVAPECPDRRRRSIRSACRIPWSIHQISDEIYQIRDFDAGGSHVLIRLDPASVDLNRENVHRHPYGWPLAWTRAYGNGRVFYTALGHEEAVWRDSRYQTLLRNAV